MIPNFELRFVKRTVAGKHIVSDIHEATTVKILQYRVKEPAEYEYDDWKIPWSEWQDVPVVEDE